MASNVLNSSFVGRTTDGYSHVMSTAGGMPDNSTGQQYPFALENVLVPIIFSIVIVVGVLGNGLVVYVMLRYGEKTTTNCYVVNLAVTDMALIVLVIPFTMMHYILPDWIFGDFMCKATMYMIYVTLHATCLTLTAMTVDRYVSIVHPISSMNKRSPKIAVSVSVGIWILSLLLCIPFFMYNGIREATYYGPRIYCRETWPMETFERDTKISVVYVVIATYVVPLTVIVLCYALTIRFLWNRHDSRPTGQPLNNGHRRCVEQNRRRKRQRVTRMVAVIVILFATFWMPIHIFHLWFQFDPYFPKGIFLYSYKIFAHILSYANSCVNPIVYCFLGDSFRKAVRKAFPKYFKKTMMLSTCADDRGQSLAVTRNACEEANAPRCLAVDQTIDQTEMSELIANNNSTNHSSEPVKKRLLVATTVLNQFQPLVIEEDGELLESTPIPGSASSTDPIC